MMLLNNFLLLGATAFLVSAKIEFVPEIAWCRDGNLSMGPCVSEYDVSTNSTCRLIPDSNANGDFGSGVFVSRLILDQ